MAEGKIPGQSSSIDSLDDIFNIGQMDEEDYDILVIDFKRDEGDTTSSGTFENLLAELDKFGLEYRYVEMEKRPYLSRKAG